MSQNKKVLSFLGIIFIIALGYIVYRQFYNPTASGPYFDQIRGKVVKVDGNTVTVEGYLVDVPKDLKKLVTIDFTLTDKTIYSKDEVLINAKLYPPGKPFTPKMVKTDGVESDIAVNTTIENIKASGNLYNQTKGKAQQVTYQIFSYDIPK